ncbi:MAG: prepilin peptidase, partial [Gammaproteobacteria bacterium]|nr:prepilin peptidase [Gammaproteobacteria bacterium]
MDAILTILGDAPALLAIISGLFGLLFGSFLNVVIYRLPIMMERDWHRQYAEFEEREVPDEPGFNLVTPRSACPQCDRPIRAWENIPVVSWLMLRGKCAGCSQRISPRYPAIELV